MGVMDVTYSLSRDGLQPGVRLADASTTRRSSKVELVHLG